MLETVEGGAAGEIDEYRLVRPLGDGPEASTFLAHDRLLDRAVVLRVLVSDAAEGGERLAAARALARVSHPSLCVVHRVRAHQGRPYIVSSYVRGEPLAALEVPQPPDRVLAMARSLAGAIATLHAAGVAYGHVRADRVVVSSDGSPRFVGFGGARAHASADALRKDVVDLVRLLAQLAGDGLRARLTALVDGRDGPPPAEDLLGSLEALAHPFAAQEALDQNPYRGLRPFGAEHASLFFGRSAEVADAQARLATAPWLVVAGRSGSGKTSLVHAGLLPALREGGLGERPRWDLAVLVPGARPAEALAAALAPVLEREPHELLAALRADPALAASLTRARADAGLVLVVDALEEAWTLADADERALLFALIEPFGVISPGTRVVLTMRSDFLDRLGDLGDLGRDLLRSTLLLPPLAAPSLREIITAPARAAGYHVEGAVLDALTLEASGVEALPMLSFALAELWARRDRDRRVLGAEAFAALGSASAALARHGDVVLAALGEDERVEARRMLVALATRGRCTREALLSSGGRAAPGALDGLVRGRLVAAGETYEIAHVSIGVVWPRLRAWLEEASDVRSGRARLAVAARDWDRAGRREDALWGERQMRELDAPGALDAAGDVELAFVASSRRASRFARLRRVALRVVTPLGLALVALAVFGARAQRDRRDRDAFVAARIADARAASQEAQALDAEVVAAQDEAFRYYDRGDWTTGETRWRESGAVARREADRFAAALGSAGLALGRAPDSAPARAAAADVTYRWLLVAERDHERTLVPELRAGLAQVDDGSWAARLDAPARLVVRTGPDARLSVRPVRASEGRRLEGDAEPLEVGARVSLAPGSYVVEASAPGRAATRLPLLLARGQDATVDLALPDVAAVPPGFVYVPEGVSLVGSPDVEVVRRGLGAPPEHPARVGAFLIGAHEVTFGEYLAFLEALAPPDRAARRPGGLAVELSFGSDGAPTLRLGAFSARAGEPLCRPKRRERRCQDWRQMPAVGLTWDDASAYAAWLSAKRPGARLCTELEWERAARGADGRAFPMGDVLVAGDANFNATYSADGEQLGVDAVGAFPLDRSPFGVFDMAGNATEWIGDSIRGDRPGVPVARGGAWSDEILTARSAARQLRPDRTGDILGTRICLPYP